MRVVLQRVERGSVAIDGKTVGEIGRGLVLLVGFAAADGDDALAWMADKVAGLRVFADDEGKMNRSIEEVGGALLVVSQFTLYGDARKGRRPSFVDAAPLTLQFFALVGCERGEKIVKGLEVVVLPQKLAVQP